MVGLVGSFLPQTSYAEGTPIRYSILLDGSTQITGPPESPKQGVSPSFPCAQNPATEYPKFHSVSRKFKKSGSKNNRKMK